jgi:2-hydroxy-3-oxopropionate reductase
MEIKKIKRIGFIGLGIMGLPMAKNLMEAGYALTVFDIDKNRMEALPKARKASTCREVATASDIIITMLPNSPHVKEAVLGKGGVIEGAQAGAILIDMSSIAPLASKEIAEALKKKNIEMLDAPVSGGEPKAVNGTLAIMVGGPEEVFEKIKPILEVMGGSVTLVGEIGSGNMTKLANQIIVALNIAAVSEAMVLATKSGVDPEKVFQAIRGGLAGSTVLEAKMPLILDGNFKPGFRIELHIKDLANALDTAHALGVPIPLSSVVMEEMQALRADGKSDDDHGGLVQFYEGLAKLKVRRTKKK